MIGISNNALWLHITRAVTDKVYLTAYGQSNVKGMVYNIMTFMKIKIIGLNLL